LVTELSAWFAAALIMLHRRAVASVLLQ
jgi:hypothetical protein